MPKKGYTHWLTNNVPDLCAFEKSDNKSQIAAAIGTIPQLSAESLKETAENAAIALNKPIKKLPNAALNKHKEAKMTPDVQLYVEKMVCERQ